MKTNIFEKLVNAIWRFLSSVTLTVALLTLLALASIPGTIIEQGYEQGTIEKNLVFMAEIFGPDYAYQALDIVIKLGFLDAYHSWWFIILLSLLTFNLTICTLDRFPKTWKSIRTPQSSFNDAIDTGVSSKAELRIDGGIDKAKDIISKALKGYGYNPLEKKIDHALYLYSERGKYSRFGVYIIHISIILIFMGAIIGAIFGFKGYLTLSEGKMSDEIVLQDQKITKPLGFSIRCDRFNVDYYEKTNMPKDYASDIAILKDGKEILKKSIKVNDPLTFEGVTFYQSGYGSIKGTRYTGLLVSRDPGMGIVYLGFVLMTIGLIVTFFTHHKRVWIRLIEESGHVVVTLAGTVNKNRTALEKEFERLVKSIKNE